MKTIVEKIVDREIEAAIVLENDLVVAFLDHDPIQYGHVLICPKTPYVNFIDVPQEVCEALMSAARLIYKKIQEKYKPSGISFIQNNGSCNELQHFHLHIFPRYKGDSFSWHSTPIGQQNLAQLNEEAKGLF